MVSQVAAQPAPSSIGTGDAPDSTTSASAAVGTALVVQDGPPCETFWTATWTQPSGTLAHRWLDILAATDSNSKCQLAFWGSGNTGFSLGGAIQDGFARMIRLRGPKSNRLDRSLRILPAFYEVTKAAELRIKEEKLALFAVPFVIGDLPEDMDEVVSFLRTLPERVELDEIPPMRFLLAARTSLVRKQLVDLMAEFPFVQVRLLPRPGGAATMMRNFLSLA